MWDIGALIKHTSSSEEAEGDGEAEPHAASVAAPLSPSAFGALCPKLVERVQNAHRGWVTSLVAIGEDLVWSGSPDKHLKVWDGTRRQELQSFGPLKGWVWCLLSTRDGRRLWCASNDKAIRIYRMWGAQRRAAYRRRAQTAAEAQAKDAENQQLTLERLKARALWLKVVSVNSWHRLCCYCASF